jgi:hypothetical protein
MSGLPFVSFRESGPPVWINSHISVAKSAGTNSWEILVSLPRYELYVSTPNLSWALTLAADLIIIAPAAPRDCNAWRFAVNGE